jgi:glycosyltransferase involved in cell wall biosynthesis
MMLLIGMPAFNEEASIEKVIGSLPQQLDGVDEIRVVVVDDGSSDQTSELAARAGADVVRHPTNIGVGAAFQSIYRHALRLKADLLVTIDADGQFPADKIDTLIAPILAGKALVCTASRFKDPDFLPTMPRVKKWGNARVAGLVSTMTGRKYADVSCGFRAYAREALLRLTVYHSFTYTHETFLDLAIKNIPISEVPMKIRGVREHGQSKVASSVLRYGVRTAAIMLRTYRDHRPLRLAVAVSIPLFLLALGLGGFSFSALIASGRWAKWAAFAGGGMGALAIAVLFFGFLADMATRIRKNQEEIIYWVRQT